jgi:Kef-type K+ transport system membrane component KefB
MAVGFGMNARGAMEIILGLIALENGLINEKLFVALVVMAIITSMSSGPLMKWSVKKAEELPDPVVD